MRRFYVLLLVCLASPAYAAWPPGPSDDLSAPSSWPNDPGYAGQWNLWSFTPAENAPHLSAYEASVGVGMHADQAWTQTIGDPQVVIAVLDSGVRWGERDLVNKWYLNRGELPVPAASCGVATGSDPYDVNGDGVFNVQDYTTATGHQQPDAATICDARVHDANGNGILDPEDLILIFSDGVDSDGNGWVDDISGWDAFHDDNDPADDTDFGHGTGEAKDSSAETDNGIGDAGVCPRCTVMMVRVGDSFVADSNDFATAAIFAIDSGASVIQEALGTLNGTPAMHAAIEYAWQKNVTVVASAADEDSFHANLPGSVNHTIYVHANRYDTSDRASATTFMAFNNCTNYGAQLLLSTPGTACSSEATGKTSGAVGLILSAGRAAAIDPPLQPEEVKQLLLENVDDIYDPNDATNPDRYTTLPGWDKRFGYGRTNVGRAVQATFAQKIPPVVDVWTPDWFQVIDAGAGSTPVTGEISYRTNLYSSYDYVVEWAPGIEPADADWHTLASGNRTAPLSGELARFDAADLAVMNPPLPPPDRNVDQFMVTVRVRVTLHSPNLQRDGTRGEIRRAFHVHRDPDLLPGFPIKLAGSGEASAKVTDLDGDGVMEIVTADAGGQVTVIGGDGQAKPGWPQHTDTLPAWQASSPHVGTGAVRDHAIDPTAIRTPILQGPAVGDLLGQGKDVVVATFDGFIYAWDAGGRLLPGFPVTLDRSFAAVTDPKKVVDSGVFAAPVVTDLDGDGKAEIVVAAMDGHVYAWHGDASPVAGFPVLLQSGDQLTRIVETPSVGDLDGDGKPEIVCGTNEFYTGLGRLYALHADGSMVAGWPVSLPTQNVLPVVGTGLPNSTAMADVDGDGKVDVAATGIVSVPQILRGDTSTIGIVANSPFGASSNSTDMPAFIAIANGSFGDLDNDQHWDVIWDGIGAGYANASSNGGKRVDFDHQLDVWSTQSLAYLPGFPQRMDDHQFFMNPAVADLDGDGKPEVIAGSGGYFLHAFDADGVEPAGWPKFTGGWIIASPAVGDLGGDGTLDVVVATREGYLWAWRTTGRVDGRVDWASFHHDDGNTGNVETPIGFGAHAGETPHALGGCCDSGGGRAAGSLLCALATLTAVRRRRRPARAATGS